ncbi:Flagellar motor component [Verrucomicrobia bacterium]|nr:Flagellar motor component [Verrucomicrobiota bacterium]
MIVVVGVLMVIASVAGGFLMGGGHFQTLMHLSELVIIGGAAMGAVVIMAPKRVLVDLARALIHVFKGTPYKRKAYEQLFLALYELFLLGRRNGLIALEEHLTAPANSSIFQRYPGVLANHDALEFLCSALRPVIDGRVKPDQLRQLLDTDLTRMAEEGEAPISVLTRAADAMPGFGIVAAVLGIVITMASIAGPIEQIGIKVAAALVGTFLGIFLGYGFLSPLAVNMEFNVMARLAFFRCISASVISFASGMAPGMAVEIARRSLSEDLRPGAEELEAMFKTLNANVAKSK